MPGAELVPRRAGQLRRPPAAPRRRGPTSPATRRIVSTRASAWPRRLRRSSWPATAPRRSAVLATPPARAMGVQPGDRVACLAGQHAAHHRRLPRLRVAGRGVVACVRRTWARWRCSTASARSRRSCCSPSTARSTAAREHDRRGRCCAQLLDGLPSVSSNWCWWPTLDPAGDPSRGLGDRHARPGPPTGTAMVAPPGAGRGRHRAAPAALRPSAVGRLQQRHHRPAQGRSCTATAA